MPLRDAIHELWRVGTPKESYQIADDVPNPMIDLSVRDATSFEDVVRRISDGAKIKYAVKNNTYFFTADPEAAYVLQVKVVRDKLTLIAKNADLESVLQTTLDTFSKSSDINVNGDPTEELRAYAKRVANTLSSPTPPGPPGIDPIGTLKSEARAYLKPPKPRQGKAVITTEMSDFCFKDAIDSLSNAGGFLWFLRNNKYVIRNTTSADRVRDIFRDAGILDQIQK